MHGTNKIMVPSKLIDRDSPEKPSGSKIVKLTMRTSESQGKGIRIRRSSQTSKLGHMADNNATGIAP